MDLHGALPPMDLKLTFLGRAAHRWRVRVEMPPGCRPRGMTVGLWSEDDKPLGPAVVAPPGVDGAWEVEVSGPSPLPPGTRVRCVADAAEKGELVYWLGVDRRRGLHAFLHADARLPVESSARGAAMSEAEVERLARSFAWIRPEPELRVRGGGPCSSAELPPEMQAMLREEFGVELDDEL